MRPLLLALLFAAPAALAQAPPARIGAGLDALVIPLRAGDVDPGVGLGLRGRVALPINSDLSAAGSVGVTANLAGSAVLTAAPQVSLIVGLPGEGPTGRYVMGGFGALVPFSGGGGGGTLHVGFGWTVPLSETEIYFEVNPAVVVGSSDVTVAVPLRAGFIF